MRKASSFSRFLLVCCSIFIISARSFTCPFPTKGERPRTIMNSSSGNDESRNAFDVKTWNPLRLLVLRLGFTEPAWTSPLNYQKKEGTFSCAYCGQALFNSDAKYDSGSGWPSFWRTIEEGAVSYKMEFDGRLECRCGRCQSHLGHVFLDGPRPTSVSQEILRLSPESDPRSKTDNGRLPRFCINGASLRVEETS
jgi:peptide-methionine (R)-S-oxide reductase